MHQVIDSAVNAFHAWNGEDLTGMPVLIKAHENVQPIISQWLVLLKYRRHLDNISNNCLIEL